MKYFTNENTLWALKILSGVGGLALIGAIWYAEVVLIISLNAVSINLFRLAFDFIFDLERTLFFIRISWIRVSVFTYRLNYIHTDPTKDRFFMLLFRFVLSIWILVFSGNFYSLLIGWDGLGVTSFLLVIYFQNKNSTNAGLITLLTNRVGDVLIIIRLILFIRGGRGAMWSWRIAGGDINPLALMMLVSAAFTKRAQLPFSRWLPAAIAAPTPVSSLVHSSTLVTAGVFILLRFKDFLSHAWPARTELMLITGAATIVIAGIGGLLEDDFKKMVALSTLSQLGLIICCLGLRCFQVAFFHLLIHAYFKALIFIATGATIHASGDYQDLRVIRVPFLQSKFTSRILLVRNLRLIGLPFLRGFYSKDLILEIWLSGGLGAWGACLFVCGTRLTALYALRFLSLSGGRRSLRGALQRAKDSAWDIFKRYDMLFILAVAGGRVVNYIYMTYPPTLALSPELKNSVLLLIIASWVLHSTGALQLSYPTTKRTLGLILGLTILSPGILKTIASSTAVTTDKTIEKFLARKILIGRGGLLTQNLMLLRRIRVFWRGAGMTIIALFILFFRIEFINPSFGLGFGFALKIFEI